MSSAKKQPFTKDAIPSTVEEEEENRTHPEELAGDVDPVRSTGSLRSLKKAESDPPAEPVTPDTQVASASLRPSTSEPTSEPTTPTKHSTLISCENVEDDEPKRVKSEPSRPSTPSPLRLEDVENDEPRRVTSEPAKSSTLSSPSLTRCSRPQSPTPTKRSKLARSLSSQSLLKNALSGSTNLFKKGRQSREPNLTPSETIRRTPSQGPVRSRSGIDSPDIQDMFKRDSVPDLDAVTRALETLNRDKDEPDELRDAYTESLESVAEALSCAADTHKKLLKEAMADRDSGNVEKCRAKCVLIVSRKHAEVQTKVYAFNILSMQASPGQAMNFLREAEKLIADNLKEKPELEKLLGVTRSLRESARARDAAGEKSRFNRAKEGSV